MTRNELAEIVYTELRSEMASDGSDLNNVAAGIATATGCTIEVARELTRVGLTSMSEMYR